MNKVEITENILYVGVNDRDIDLFEGQYVVPEGVSYNSYLIMDEKIALMDTVDVRKSEEWLANIKVILGTRQPDYLVVSHMEPDHAGSIAVAVEEFPDMKLVGNAKTFAFMEQFFGFDINAKKIVVADGDVLALGKHKLKFIGLKMESQVLLENQVRMVSLFLKLKLVMLWVQKKRFLQTKPVGKTI